MKSKRLGQFQKIIKLIFELLTITCKFGEVKCADKYKISLLKTFVPTSKSSDYPRSYHEVRVEYLSWKNSNEIEVVNLNNFLPHNCFTFIDNFPDVHWNPLADPLIVRHLLPFVVESDRSQGDLSYIWGQRSPLINNATISIKSTEESCVISKFLETRYESSGPVDFCIHLNAKKIVLNSKPWNCVAYFGMFPPWQFMNNMNPAYQFHKSILIGHQKLITFSPPSAVPLIHAIIFAENVSAINDSPDWKYWLLDWIDDAMRERDIHHDFFFYFTVSRATSNNLSFADVGKITEISVMTKCENYVNAEGTPDYICPGVTGITYKNLHTKMFPRKQSEIRLLPQIMASQDQSLMWRLKVQADKTRLLKTIEKFICSGKDKFRLNFEITEEQDDRLALGFASAWRSIIRNGTCAKPISTSLVGTIRTVPYLKNWYYPRFPFQNQIDNLRFVSCGMTKYSGVPFVELINIFDTSTWLAIFSCAVATAIPLWSIASPKSVDLVGHVISLMKVLLEQGDPFRGDIAKISNLRVVVGGFLVASIVISNAYKNDNIYNMIVERRVIPYEKFSELVKEDFTFYTITKSITQHHEDSLRLANCRFQFRSETVRRSILCADSEINSTLDTINHVVKIWPHMPQQNWSDVMNSSASLALGIHSRVTLHPRLLWDLLNLKMKEVPHYHHYDISSRFKVIEKTYLYESLRSCSKMALILPELMCNQFAQNLTRINKFKNVFVGKEVYSDSDWMFTLEGWIPLHVIKRFKGMGEAGVWKWWMQLVMSRYGHESRNEREPPTPVHIGGNVIIVFTMWCVGIFIALQSFVVEIRKNIYALIGRTIRSHLLKLKAVQGYIAYYIRNVRGVSCRTTKI